MDLDHNILFPNLRCKLLHKFHIVDRVTIRKERFLKKDIFSVIMIYALVYCKYLTYKQPKLLILSIS